MKRARIKICGIRRPEDARLACSLGADYLGVIFAPSPRRVTVKEACAVREASPDGRLVGVFLDTPADDVIETARASGLDFIQLHGSESPEYCSEIGSRSGLPVIKAFSSDRLPDTHTLGLYDTTGYFLFDLDKSHIENGATVSQIENLWDDAARERKRGFRLFVAGALDEHNVRAAIERTHAFCVDVCRGIESKPGVKDAGKMQRFIREVTS